MPESPATLTLTIFGTKLVNFPVADDTLSSDRSSPQSSGSTILQLGRGPAILTNACHCINSDRPLSMPTSATDLRP